MGNSSSSQDSNSDNESTQSSSTEHDHANNKDSSSGDDSGHETVKESNNEGESKEEKEQEKEKTESSSPDYLEMTRDVVEAAMNEGIGYSSGTILKAMGNIDAKAWKDQVEHYEKMGMSKEDAIDQASDDEFPHPPGLG